MLLPRNLWAPPGAAARSLPPPPWDFRKEIGGGGGVPPSSDDLRMFEVRHIERPPKELSKFILYPSRLNDTSIAANSPMQHDRIHPSSTPYNRYHLNQSPNQSTNHARSRFATTRHNQRNISQIHHGRSGKLCPPQYVSGRERVDPIDVSSGLFVVLVADWRGGYFICIGKGPEIERGRPLIKYGNSRNHHGLVHRG